MQFPVTFIKLFNNKAYISFIIAMSFSISIPSQNDSIEIKTEARKLLESGYFQYLNENYSNAISTLQKAKNQYTFLNDWSSSYYCDMYLIDCLIGIRKYKKALFLIDSVCISYKRSINDNEYAWLLTLKMLVYKNLEHYTTALQYSDSIKKLYKTDNALHNIYFNQALNIKAQCLSQIGSFEESRNCYFEAIYNTKTENSYDSIISSGHYLSLAKIYKENFQYDSSYYYLNFAQKYCDTTNNNNVKTFCDILILKAIVKNKQNQTNQALHYLNIAENNLINDPYTRAKQSAIIFHNKANAYFIGNNLDSAIIYFTKAIKISKDLGFSPLKGHYRALANIYLKLNLPDSVNHYIQLSLSCYNKDSIINTHKLKTLLDYCSFLINYYDEPKGIKLLDDLNPSNPNLNYSNNLKLQYYLINGDYLIKQNKLDESIEFYNSANEIINNSFSFKHGLLLATPEIINFYNKYVLLFLKLYNKQNEIAFLVNAQKYSLSVLKMIYHLQLTSGDFSNKIFLAEKYNAIIDKQIIAWSHIQENENPFKKSIISYLLFFKKFMLTLGLSSGNLAKVQGDIPPLLLELEHNLNDKLSSYYKDLHNPYNKLYEGNEKSGLQYARYAVTLDSLIGEFEKNYKTYYLTKYKTPEFNPEEVKQCLNNDQILLDYTSLGDSMLFVQYYTRNSYNSITLPLDSSFHSYISALRKFMSKDAIRNCPPGLFSEYMNAANCLYNVLIGNIINSINNKELIIIPPVCMQGIPFDILIVETNNRSNNFKSPEYLIKYSSIAYDYSISSFLARKNQSSNLSDFKILSIHTGNGADSTTLENLPESKIESNNLTSLFHGTSYPFSSLTQSQIEELSKQYNILHFALHSDFLNSDALLSSLYESNDSLSDALFAIDIMNLNLSNDLLVLSGCNTSLGPHIKGKGPFSIAKAFYIAGCHNQLITLNKIEDHISSTIISSFFNNLKQGKSQSKALQQSKLDYLKNTAPINSHPYYWSSFLLIGNSHTSTKCPIHSIIQYLGILTLAVIILILLYRLRKKFQHKQQKL